MSEIVLRPHHGMCFQFYEGKGYSEDFTDHMGKIIKMMENAPDTMIKVNACTDEVCSSCPNNSEGICKSNEKVLRYDNNVLKACHISDGVSIRYRDFIDLVKSRIIDTGSRSKICGDCEWNDICKSRK